MFKSGESDTDKPVAFNQNRSMSVIDLITANDGPRHSEHELYSPVVLMDTAHPAICSHAFVRTILYANFCLFALFVIPITNHWVDRGFLALRSINMEDVVGRSLQVWIVTSTIIATALFTFVVWKSRRATAPIRALRFEAILLLIWWIIVLGACAYGFMLGMGG